MNGTLTPWPTRLRSDATVVQNANDFPFCMVLAGGALGLGVALATSRMLKSLLFQISVYDPFTFIVVPLLLCLVALVAILIPARAGMRVDPAVALRNE